MADHPPSTDPEPPRTTRTDEAALRRASARRRAAGIAVVAALAVAGGFLVLGGEDGPPLGDGETDAPGSYSFDLKTVRASTYGDTPAEDLQDVAEDAGEAIKATMDELYFRTFVDRGSWGDYREAFELFDGPAGARAEQEAEILTLGSAAADDYEQLVPGRGILSILVLTDGRARPVSAIATVSFLADAERRDGTSTTVASTGSYFLRPVEDVWRIFAYRVTRDETGSATASPTGSPS